MLKQIHAEIRPFVEFPEDKNREWWMLKRIFDNITDATRRERNDTPTISDNNGGNSATDVAPS